MDDSNLTNILSEEELQGILDESPEVSSIPKKKELPKKPWWIDQPDLTPDLRTSDIDPMGTRSMHKTTNMASQEALDWLSNQKSRFGKLKNMLKSSAPVAKQVGKRVVGAGLGLAGLLLQDELGPEKGSDEDIIEDPRASIEERKAAMVRVRNKYLKPQED